MKTDAEKAFFDALANPAALCDEALTLLAANPAFKILCGEHRTLAQLLRGATLPKDGSASEVEVLGPSGERVSLVLSRKGEAIAVFARNLMMAAWNQLPDRRRTDQALLELGREVALAAGEEDLVAVVARGVKGLFPGRAFCLRFVDPRSLALTSLYAEGPLREGDRGTLVLKRSAVEKTHLKLGSLPEGRLQVSEDEPPLLFRGTHRGIATPLVAAGQLFGVINVEYGPDWQGPIEADDKVLVQLANQVAVGVRNAKLIDELTFVRTYLEDLLEHANALILVANRDRTIRVFNQRLAAITGFRKEEVLGQDLLRFIPEAERLRFLRVVSSSLKGEQVSHFETRILTRSGHEVKVSVSTSSVLDPQGEIEGVIAIGQDVTALRELEKRFVQAEKLATLGKLAASVVHEINNPMTAVSTYADALLMRARTLPGTEADQEKLKRILENSDRILRFTRDLVTYSRPAQDLPTPLDLNEAVEVAIRFCEHVVRATGAQVVRQLSPLPKVPGVRGNLVQVFVNLITNACHAMTRGGSVTVATRLEGEDAVVILSDTGDGIDPAHLEQIFEPFFTTKPEGRGTGLGLSIVQGIIEKHGGQVKVTSVVGEGTTFTIRLPLGERRPPAL